VNIGPSAVPELHCTLRHKDFKVRNRVADILGRMGPVAKQAVPGLVAALEDPTPLVRTTAAKALKRIDPDAAKKAGVP
jgi:HEAT repeat protein